MVFVTTLWLGCLLKDKSNNQKTQYGRFLKCKLMIYLHIVIFLDISTVYAERDGHKVTKQE